MGKFLGEDITYINQNDVNNALRFIRQNPDATQRAVWNLFVQQKFFTNNDFSLIDVHISQAWLNLSYLKQSKQNQGSRPFAHRTKTHGCRS